MTILTDYRQGYDDGAKIINAEIALMVKERWPDLAAEALERIRARANEALVACGLPPIPKDTTCAKS